MRLSDRERRILRTLELNADLTVAEIAKQTGMQTHAVAYYISKLKSSGILGPRRASVNSYRLGFFDFHFVFSLTTGSSTKRERFISALRKSPSVAWLAEVGGTHQFAMSVRVRQIQDALSFMAGVGEKFPNVIRSQQLSIVSSVTSFGRRYLYGKGRVVPSFKNKFEEALISSLDSIDYQILRGLSELDLSSERELARLIGLPFSTVRRRIGLLEESKVINGYYHHIDAAKLGFQIFKLLIFTRSQDSRFLQQLEDFAASQENAVHYIESLGSWQNELVVEVQEAVHASQLADKLQERFESQIDTIHVIPIFRYYKASAFSYLSDNAAISSIASIGS